MSHLLRLGDLCEVTVTLCTKTLNLVTPVQHTGTNPLETMTIFFSSSFHYFLSCLLRNVSSTIIFFFPNHTQEEQSLKKQKQLL